MVDQSKTTNPRDRHDSLPDARKATIHRGHRKEKGDCYQTLTTSQELKELLYIIGSATFLLEPQHQPK